MQKNLLLTFKFYLFLSCLVGTSSVISNNAYAMNDPNWEYNERLGAFVPRSTPQAQENFQRIRDAFAAGTSITVQPTYTGAVLTPAQQAQVNRGEALHRPSAN